MGRRIRAMVGTVLVVAVPAVTIRLLHGMADRPWFDIEYNDLGHWMATTDLVDALAAIARVAALAIAYYLLISTLLYLVALTTGSQSLIRVTRPFTIPMVRTLADRVIAGSIAVSSIAAPLIASAPPAQEAGARPSVSSDVAADYLPSSRLVQDVQLVPPSTDALETSVAFTERPTTPPPQAPVGAPVPTDITAGPSEVVVTDGDHLWGLAETRIAQALGRDPLEHEVAPYWRVVIDQNRSRIRSGNPDLIFPGEVILLPDPAPHLPAG